MKGVPLRIELGPRDIEAGQCVAVSRVTGEKTIAALENIETTAAKLLDAIHDEMFARAKQNLDEHTYAAKTVDEIRSIVENGGGFIKAMWCGDEACELKLKEDAGVTSRCIPYEQEQVSDVCPVCGKPAQHMVYWGVAY